MRYKRIVDNKKGFTLVEMLVALSISALLFVIAIPSISFVQQTLEKKKFESYKTAVRSATKLYAQSYKEDLTFSGEDDSTNITLKQLIEKDLIEDYSDEIQCVQTTSTKVIKNGDKNKYCVALVCKDENDNIVYQGGDSASYCKTDFRAPDVTVKLFSGENQLDDTITANSSKYSSNITISKTDFPWYNASTAPDGLTIKVSAKDTNIKKVTIDGTDYTSITSSSGSKSINAEKSYTNEHSGNVIVKVEDSSSNYVNITLNVNYDKTKPVCNPDISDKDTTKGLTVKFNCSDEISGIKSGDSTVNGLKDSKTFEIIDNAGNISKINVQVNKYNKYYYKTRSKSTSCGTCYQTCTKRVCDSCTKKVCNTCVSTSCSTCNTYGWYNVKQVRTNIVGTQNNKSKCTAKIKTGSCSASTSGRTYGISGSCFTADKKWYYKTHTCHKTGTTSCNCSTSYYSCECVNKSVSCNCRNENYNCNEYSCNCVDNYGSWSSEIETNTCSSNSDVYECRSEERYTTP